MMKTVTILFLLILTSMLFYQAAHVQMAIRKDYECEILERDFFIKDCYRNVELNLEDREMIAGTNE